MRTSIWLIVVALSVVGCAAEMQDPNDAPLDEPADYELAIFDEEVGASDSELVIVPGPSTGLLPFIKSARSFRCVDAPIGYAGVVQHTCHDGTLQDWIMEYAPNGVRFRNVYHGRCLTAQGGSRLGLETCRSSGDPGQTFEIPIVGQLIEHTINGDVRHSLQNVRSRANGLCLDIPNGSTANSVPLQLYSCNNGLNQLWFFF